MNFFKSDKTKIIKNICCIIKLNGYIEDKFKNSKYNTICFYCDLERVEGELNNCNLKFLINRVEFLQQNYNNDNCNFIACDIEILNNDDNKPSKLNNPSSLIQIIKNSKPVHNDDDYNDDKLELTKWSDLMSFLYEKIYKESDEEKSIDKLIVKNEEKFLILTKNKQEEIKKITLTNYTHDEEIKIEYIPIQKSDLKNTLQQESNEIKDLIKKLNDVNNTYKVELNELNNNANKLNEEITQCENNKNFISNKINKYDPKKWQQINEQIKINNLKKENLSNKKQEYKQENRENNLKNENENENLIQQLKELNKQYEDLKKEYKIKEDEQKNPKN